jgi:hypothetical protein
VRSRRSDAASRKAPFRLTVGAPHGLVQSAFEIVDDQVTATYVVRNPDKLRHLTAVERLRKKRLAIVRDCWGKGRN